MAKPPTRRRTKRVATVEEMEAAWWAHQLGTRPETATSPKGAIPDVVDSSPIGDELEQAPAFRVTDPVGAAAAWWEHQLGSRPETATSPKHKAIPDVVDGSAIGGELEQAPAFRVPDPVGAASSKVEGRSPEIVDPMNCPGCGGPKTKRAELCKNCRKTATALGASVLTHVSTPAPFIPRTVKQNTVLPERLGEIAGLEKPGIRGEGLSRPVSYQPRETTLTQLTHQVNAIRYARQGRYATARQALVYLLICLVAVLVGWLVASIA